jgi:hypothetical protein
MVPVSPAGSLDAATATRRLLEAFLAGRGPQTLRAYKRDVEDFAAFVGVARGEEGTGRGVQTVRPRRHVIVLVPWPQARAHHQVGARGVTDALLVVGVQADADVETVVGRQGPSGVAVGVRAATR